MLWPLFALSAALAADSASAAAAAVAGGKSPPNTVQLRLRLSSPRMADEEVLLLANFSQTRLDFKATLPALVVELDPKRACRRSAFGLDRTLSGAVAVVRVGAMAPWLTGCISPINQRDFAAASGAKALLLSAQRPLPALPSSKGALPTIIVHGLHSAALETSLRRARTFDQSLVLWLEPYTNTGLHFPIFRGQERNAEEESAKRESEDKVVGVGSSSGMAGAVHVGVVVSVVLVLLLFFLATFLKHRWPRPRRLVMGGAGKAEAGGMEGLAKVALSAMETRAFCPEAPKRRKLFPKLPKPPAAAPTDASVLTLDACPICLEDYRDSEELRVLPCGHEFHRACVDPWIILQRTCPLCQYDTVLQDFPSPAPGPSSAQPTPPTATANPLIQSREAVPVVTAAEAGFFVLSAPSYHRLRTYHLPSSSHRRPNRKRRPKAAGAAASSRLLPPPSDPGYLSDISSMATTAAAHSSAVPTPPFQPQPTL